MTLFHLVICEIRHRWWNFVLAFLSVTVAVACLVASLTVLKAHEIQTDRILATTRDDVERRVATREKQVKQAGAALRNAMRKITKNLGFNVYILPRDQDLSEWHTKGTLSKTMPESFVKTLADSEVMTINHILPMVTHRIENWPGPQKPQTILVAGTRGEVPFARRTSKKPLEGGEALPPGTIILGFDVHSQQTLDKGHTVKLLGLDLKVSKVHPQRGTIDDSTVWINLKQAQEALGKQNVVNLILALECNCESEDRIGDIRRDIAGILPGTKVIELDTRKALARAEARNKAKKQAQTALKAAQEDGAKQLEVERRSRATLGEQRESFASILVPLVIGGCAVWIAFLAFGNVRQRGSEIGILRAIGLRSSEILAIFLSKALTVGVLGGAVGYLVGFGLGLAWGDLPMTADSGEQLFSAGFLVLAIVVAPLLSGLSSWIPAMFAARQDPAVVLQTE
ncbi:MAG: ABC transporter permease [Planctomycetaceae bacterium]